MRSSVALVAVNTLLVGLFSNRLMQQGHSHTRHHCMGFTLTANIPSTAHDDSKHPAQHIMTANTPSTAHSQHRPVWRSQLERRLLHANSANRRSSDSLVQRTCTGCCHSTCCICCTMATRICTAKESKPTKLPAPTH